MPFSMHTKLVVRSHFGLNGERLSNMLTTGSTCFQESYTLQESLHAWYIFSLIKRLKDYF